MIEDLIPHPHWPRRVRRLIERDKARLNRLQARPLPQELKLQQRQKRKIGKLKEDLILLFMTGEAIHGVHPPK